MKIAPQFPVLCAVLAASAIGFGQSAPGDKILTRDEILKGLNKKPELSRAWGNTRTIGVAAKPEITTTAILFKFGTTDIEGDESWAQIKELGKALEDPTMKSASIEIEGHTDNVGSEDYNRKLSEARAQRIVQELRQHYNLAAKQLVPVGKGKSEPAVGSKEKQTDAERAQNRRVVVKRLDQ